PEFDSYVLTFIAGLTVYVYRAGYAQAELLYYGLFLLSFLLALSLLRAPRWGSAALCGVVMGVAYLTKASVLPLLAALVFWGMLASATKPSSGAAGRARLRTVAAALLVGMVFLLTVSPYLHTSKQRFGRWFYNVNTSIYMWADSWDEVNQVMTGSGDREHWPEVPEQLLPSPTRYLEQHSLADVASRLAAGFWTSELRHLLQKPFGYGKYLIFYSLIALTAAIRWREQVALVCIKDGRWIQTGFVLTVVLGYLIAYAFYSPIVRGPRLVLSLYLPTMFSIFWMLSRRELTGQPLWSNERFELRMIHVHVSALVVLRLRHRLQVASHHRHNARGRVIGRLRANRIHNAHFLTAGGACSTPSVDPGDSSTRHGNGKPPTRKLQTIGP
ncbi:MAG: hypothetical protein JRJ58_17575, partial [Deltaproteobacteria bacterium]|nr:hypothetical protein [Deltaproteobacteria bacterium]